MLCGLWCAVLLPMLKCRISTATALAATYEKWGMRRMRSIHLHYYHCDELESVYYQLIHFVSAFHPDKWPVDDITKKKSLVKNQFKCDHIQQLQYSHSSDGFSNEMLFAWFTAWKIQFCWRNVYYPNCWELSIRIIPTYYYWN